MRKSAVRIGLARCRRRSFWRAPAFGCWTLLLVSALHAQWRVAPQAPVVRPEIVRVIRHDPTASTQGLLLVGPVLYESTGLAGQPQSSLRRVDARTGDVIVKIPVPDVFAEGITIFNGELVQLTWKDGFALRYDYPSLNLKPVRYRYAGEGWGLTNDNTGFIMSNGSDTLYFRNENFEVTRRIPVTLNGRPLTRLNELEYLRGHVYANVWYQNFIAEISVADGRVTRVIDCTELVRIERPRPRDNEFNGIAYCGLEDVWYLTGKNWRNMFIVRIPE
jgi:glutamine cyclotransferase